MASKWGVEHTLAAVAAVLLAFPPVAFGQAPGAPSNDNYLESKRINDPGTALTGDVGDRQNTTNASVQADLFSPPRSGGPAEPTTCRGTAIGKTVWYDFYPDVTGLVRIRASGFNAVITVIPFNAADARPNFGEAQCSDASSGVTEEVIANVRRGAAYTVQVGGAGGASGDLEFLLDFLPNTDGDGVIDGADRCPRIPGTKDDGCPAQLRASPRFAFKLANQGILVQALSIRAPAGAAVDVRCAGCRRQRVVARRSGAVSFRRLRGRLLRAGTKLEVRVTQRNMVGSYFAWTISSRGAKRIERCIPPRSSQPSRKCD